MAEPKLAPPVARLSTSDYPRGPARIRLPRRIAKGDVIRIQAKVRHPSRTGLKMTGEHAFGPDPDNPAIYIRLLEIYYGNTKIAWYEMSSAISDDPIVTFPLKASREAPVRVVFTSSEGKTYETSAPLKFTVD